MDWWQLFQNSFCFLEYRSQNPEGGVLFHFADCTAVSERYEPLREIDRWMKLVDDRGSALIHGNGEIAWISDGRVLRVEATHRFENAAEFVQFTQKIFANDG